MERKKERLGGSAGILFNKTKIDQNRGLLFPPCGHGGIKTSIDDDVCISNILSIKTAHLTVACSLTWRLGGREVEVFSVLIQTSPFLNQNYGVLLLASLHLHIKALSGLYQMRPGLPLKAKVTTLTWAVNVPKHLFFDTFFLYI